MLSIQPHSTRRMVLAGESATSTPSPFLHNFFSASARTGVCSAAGGRLWRRCRVRRDARDLLPHHASRPAQVTGSGSGVRRTTGATVTHLIYCSPQDVAGHRLCLRRHPCLYAAGRRLRYGQQSSITSLILIRCWSPTLVLATSCR